MKNKQQNLRERFSSYLFPSLLVLLAAKDLTSRNALGLFFGQKISDLLVGFFVIPVKLLYTIFLENNYNEIIDKVTAKLNDSKPLSKWEAKAMEAALDISWNGYCNSFKNPYAWLKADDYRGALELAVNGKSDQIKNKIQSSI